MLKKILLLLIMFFSLTGCYDHKELNEIAILTASEINKKKRRIHRNRSSSKSTIKRYSKCSSPIYNI